MASQAFVTSAAVTSGPRVTLRLTRCSFSSRPKLRSVARSSRSVFRMQSEDYVIQQSEYVDPEGDDDSGDGFIGEKDMDDHLGIAMPDDLPSFDVRAINKARNRDELESALRDIHSRRRDVYEDRRRGLGMDTAEDYLKNL
eukprot:GFKZ01005117.1.p1 GENE.GFKZ01005117.1~~GFKZ01005117.1.p1  ORF type:complete len:141 (-),score=23.78 GFKZ01005117.1:765-1187(-)